MGLLLPVPVTLIVKCDSMQSNDDRVLTVIPSSNFAPLTSLLLTSAGTTPHTSFKCVSQITSFNNKKVEPLEAWPIISASRIHMPIPNEPPGSHQHCHVAMVRYIPSPRTSSYCLSLWFWNRALLSFPIAPLLRPVNYILSECILRRMTVLPHCLVKGNLKL